MKQEAIKKLSDRLSGINFQDMGITVQELTTAVNILSTVTIETSTAIQKIQKKLECLIREAHKNEM